MFSSAEIMLNYWRVGLYTYVGLHSMQSHYICLHYLCGNYRDMMDMYDGLNYLEIQPIYTGEKLALSWSHWHISV